MKLTDKFKSLSKDEITAYLYTQLKIIGPSPENYRFCAICTGEDFSNDDDWDSSIINPDLTLYIYRYEPDILFFLIYNSVTMKISCDFMTKTLEGTKALDTYLYNLLTENII